MVAYIHSSSDLIGNTMKAAIFGDDIEMYEHAIQRNGEYELSNASIKPVPAEYQSKPDEFQMNFSGRMQIKPLDLSACSTEPQYRSLSLVPRSYSEDDELIDIVAVVLFVSDICPVQRGDIEHQVRDIFLTDDSVQRSMKLAAWNRFAVSDADFLSSWSEGFVVIGLRGVRPITQKGLSLATTLSTAFVPAPTGSRADALRIWAIESMPMLEEWRAKCVTLNTDQSGKTIVPLGDISKKKATTLWQEEKFWVQASMYIFAKDFYTYIGCNSFGHHVSDEPGSKFCCPHCKTQDAQAVARATLNGTSIDASGSLKITAFAPETELIIGLKCEQIHASKKSENANALDEKLAEIKNKEMLPQIGPTNALSTSNILMWIVRVVEPVPEPE